MLKKMIKNPRNPRNLISIKNFICQANFYIYNFINFPISSLCRYFFPNTSPQFSILDMYILNILPSLKFMYPFCLQFFDRDPKIIYKKEIDVT